MTTEISVMYGSEKVKQTFTSHHQTYDKTQSLAIVLF